MVKSISKIYQNLKCMPPLASTRFSVSICVLFWVPESNGYAFFGPGVQFSVSICIKRQSKSVQVEKWLKTWIGLCCEIGGLCVLAALRKTSFWICCEQLAGIWYLLCSVRQDMHYAFSKYNGYPCDHAFNFILPSISVWLRQPLKSSLSILSVYSTCLSIRPFAHPLSSSCHIYCMQFISIVSSPTVLFGLFQSYPILAIDLI